MKLLIIFIALNIINVILQTAKSIITIKCGTFAAAGANALAYGLYTVVLIYMNCDLLLWEKVLIVATTNFIGVFIVKFIENKMNKDRLWKYEINIPKTIDITKIINSFDECTYNTVKTEKDIILNVYSYSKKSSENIMKIVKNYNLKFFVTESKITISI